MATLLNETTTEQGVFSKYSIDYTITERTFTTATISATINMWLGPTTIVPENMRIRIGVSFNDENFQLRELKAYNTSMSNNTNEFKLVKTLTTTFTINNLGIQQTNIPNNKCRVYYDNGGSIASTILDVYCNDIPIQSMHNSPVILTTAYTETNSKLLNIGIQDIDYVWVVGLSKKQVRFFAQYDNNATFNSIKVNYGLYDNTSQRYRRSYDRTYYNNDFIVDTAEFTETDGGNATNIYDHSFNFNRTYQITDSLGAVSNEYIKPTTNVIYYRLLTQVASAKRYGQTSGRVKISCSGYYHNSSIGNINQGGTYKPTITYKYYKTGDEEHYTTATVPAENITLNNGLYGVSDYVIPGTNFNYLNSYKIEIKVEDNFTEKSTTLSIPVGEAVWSEYKDRVRFKKIQVDGDTECNDVYVSGKIACEDIYSNSFLSTNQVFTNELFAGATSGDYHLKANIYRGWSNNANESLTEGHYFTDTRTSNLPGTNFYGYLNVKVSNGDTHNNTSNWIWQEFYNTSGEVYLRNKTNSSNWTGWRKYPFQDAIKNMFLTETKEQTTTAVASGGTKDLSYDVSKSDYTPIALAGVKTTGTRSSFVAIYQWYITGTTAHVVFRNSHPSNALVNNDTKIQITTLYVKNS